MGAHISEYKQAPFLLKTEFLRQEMIFIILPSQPLLLARLYKYQIIWISSLSFLDGEMRDVVYYKQANKGKGRLIPTYLKNGGWRI
jgi:hypothetical protein